MTGPFFVRFGIISGPDEFRKCGVPEFAIKQPEFANGQPFCLNRHNGRSSGGGLSFCFDRIDRVTP